MTAIQSFFQNLLYSIPNIGITDILDILLVSYLLYRVLRFFSATSASRAARGVIALLIFTWLTDLLNMYAIHWILSKILEIGAIALVIVFQPELRRVLERFGSRTNLSLSGRSFSANIEQQIISTTVAACEYMSKEKIGVLLVFERNNSLEDYFKTGTVIDAKLTEQLLRNLFFPKASLHDGAVIIRDGRVAAAGCVMPLSENTNLAAELGTRHRAGIGISEHTDAVAVIVSEETGTISVATGGMLKRHLAPQTLERLLISELIPAEDTKEQSFLERLKNEFDKRVNNHERQ